MVKSKVTCISPAACDQVTLRVTATGYICVKMTAPQRIVVLLVCVFFSFKCHKSGQEIVRIQHKGPIVQLFEVDHCFCKVKNSLS